METEPQQDQLKEIAIQTIDIAIGLINEHQRRGFGSKYFRCQFCNQIVKKVKSYQHLEDCRRTNERITLGE